MPLAAYCTNAFLITVVFILVMAVPAKKFGLVDMPTQRKAHRGLIPLIGGLAIFVAFLITSFLIDDSHRASWSLLAGLTLLVGVGLLDDLLDLKPSTKLVAQIAAALLLLLPGSLAISSLGHIGDVEWDLGVFAYPLTIIFVVGLTNALNMIDGLDGLAGGIAASALFWMVAMAGLAGREEIVGPLLVVLFATLGFLVFNMRHPWRRRASVFMGDAGSMMLGATIAYFVVYLCAGSHRTASFPALLWFCALPLIDMASLIVRRSRAGQSPFAGDRRHLHHILVDAGLPPQRATAVLVAFSFAMGGAGLILSRLGADDRIIICGLLVLAALHSYFVWQGWRWIKAGQHVYPAQAPASAPAVTNPAVTKPRRSRS